MPKSELLEFYREVQTRVEILGFPIVDKPYEEKLVNREYRDNLFSVVHDIETYLALFKSELRKYDDKERFVR